jgi:hypothetical protein
MMICIRLHPMTDYPLKDCAGIEKIKEVSRGILLEADV